MSRRKVFSSTLCFLLLAAMLFPMAASAAETSTFKGDSADAYFSYYSDDGCIDRSVSVWVAEEMEHSPPGPPEKGTRVQVYIFTADWCEGKQTYAFGEQLLEGGEFQVDKKLDSASLNTTVAVTEEDWSSGAQRTFDVSIQLGWTGLGEVYNGHSMYRDKVGKCMYRYRYTGSNREAEPSGSISDGVIDYAADASFSYGYLSSVKQGSVVVNCY